MNSFGIARSLAIVIVAGFSLCAADTLYAGGGSWGSRGFSSGGSGGFGSWGSSRGGFGSSRGYASGGSLGSHGSYGSRGLYRGSGPIRNLLGRLRGRISHGGSWGSRGGWSSTGSTGSLASRGSWGSSHGHGYASGGSTGYNTSYVSASTGTSYVGAYTPTSYNANRLNCGTIDCTLSAPSMSVPSMNAPMLGLPADSIPSMGPVDGSAPYYGDVVVPEGAGAIPAESPVGGDQFTPPSPSPAENGDDTGGGDTRYVPEQPFRNAVLNVNVPLEARVWINGKKTKTQGEVRSYISRHLEHGKKYKFEILAQVERNGKSIERIEHVILEPGSNKSIGFDFELTQLTLNVPEDAIVKLSGQETVAVGTTRQYKTRSLKPGDSWKDYDVEVTLNRDGKTRTFRRKLNIESGELVTLNIDFDPSRGMYVSK